MSKELIFETHAHFDDEAFAEDRHILLASMKDRGVGTVMNIGASFDSSETALELAHQYAFVYAAVGIHPEHTETMTLDTIEGLKEMAKDPKVVAIGEIGLDYHYPDPAPEIQKEWFRRQMDLAAECCLPVVIHSREAARDTLEILKEFADRGPGLKGSMHCFSYSAEVALEVIRLGYYIGIGGVITFKNARKLVEALEVIPLEKILLETDCPYMAPEPHRGKRNNSGYLPLIAARIAEYKGVPVEEVIRITRENAERVFIQQKRK